MNPRGHRLEEIALGQDPDQSAAVLHGDGADVHGRHPLGDLAEGVLGSDLDEVGRMTSAIWDMRRVYRRRAGQEHDPD